MSDNIAKNQLTDADMTNANNAVVQIKEKLEQLKKGMITEAEHKSFCDKMNADLLVFDQKCSKIQSELELKKQNEEKLLERVDYLEKQAYSIGKKTSDIELPFKEREQTKFFVEMMKKGFDFSVDEKVKWDAYIGQKYLRRDIFADGGVFVVPEFANYIIKNVVEISEMRPLANVVTIGTQSLKIPKRTGEPRAAWVGEGIDIPETQSTYGQEEIFTHAIKVQTSASWEMMQDSEFDIASQITMDTAEEFARFEGVAFVLGDKNNKPEGILENSSVETFSSVDAGVIGYKDMVDIIGKLKVPYLTNSRWLMNNRTVQEIRNITDTVGQPIWQPTMDVANPIRILGYPYALMQDFPNIPLIGDPDPTTPLIFGDVRAAYTVVDRVGMTVMRDNFTQAGRGLTRFLFFKRTGGQVVQAEAIKKLSVAVPTPELLRKAQAKVK